MKKISQKKLNAMIDIHEHWLTKARDDDYQLYLEGYDLRCKSFDSRDLRGVCIDNCNLSNTSFAGASLTGVKLHDCIGIGTYFNRADCLGLHLYSTLLDMSCFRNAKNKEKISLIHSALTQPTGITLYTYRGSHGRENHDINLFADGPENGWIIQSGCFSGTLEELKYWLKYAGRSGHELKSTMLSVNHLLKMARARVQEREKRRG